MYNYLKITFRTCTRYHQEQAESIMSLTLHHTPHTYIQWFIMRNSVCLVSLSKRHTVSAQTAILALMAALPLLPVADEASDCCRFVFTLRPRTGKKRYNVRHFLLKQVQSCIVLLLWLSFLCHAYISNGYY